MLATDGVITIDDSSEEVEVVGSVLRPESSAIPKAVQSFTQQELKLKGLRIQLDALPGSMNLIQRLDQAAGKAKVEYEAKFIDLNKGNKGQPSFQCNLIAYEVLIGRGKDSSKKGAKTKACEDAIVRLLKVSRLCINERVPSEIYSHFRINEVVLGYSTPCICYYVCFNF